MKFTLAQLAHFDRCLFPDNIAEAIGKLLGYTDIEVVLLKLELRRKAPLGVISMFQDNITDKRFCDALEKVVTEFCAEK